MYVTGITGYSNNNKQGDIADLVVNTSKIDYNHAADLILKAVKDFESRAQ